MSGSKLQRYLKDTQKETPFFVYDLESVSKQLKKIRTAFSSYKDFELLFAVKANNNEQVLKFLSKEKVGFHVSSMGELQRVQKFSKRISFTGPIIQPEVFKFIARHSSVQLNVNSLEDLRSAKDIYRLGVRINPQIGWSFNPEHAAAGPKSQFGMTAEEFSSIPQLLKARIHTLHMHTSSDSYDIKVFKQALHALLVCAAQAPSVTTINLGGGIAVPINKKDGEFPLQKFAAEIIKQVSEFKKQHDRNLRLQLEPGNYIVRGAGYYISKIFSQAERANVAYYYSDGTSHHLRGLISWRELMQVGNVRQKSKGIVFGSTCQRGDVLITERVMSKMKKGDLVVIPNTGAYCAVQAANFNMVGVPKEFILEE